MLFVSYENIYSIYVFGKISIMIAKENEQNRPASAVNLLKNGTYLKISMYILCTY